MRGSAAAVEMERPQDRNIMVIVADEPLCGALLELAHTNGFDAFACETPLDVISTLVEVGDRVAYAFVASAIDWGKGLTEFLADEYPHVDRVLL